jgi:hypothetical protein
MRNIIEGFVSHIDDDSPELEALTQALVRAVMLHELGHVLEDEDTLDSRFRLIRVGLAHKNEYKKVFE